MLAPEGCRARRERLWNRLPSRPDWVLIADPAHLMYFASYYQSPFVFRANDAGAVLILGADGSSILVADSMVKAFLEKAHVDEVVAPVWYRGVESAPHRRALLVKNVLERLGKCPGKQFGAEFSQIPAGILEGLRSARPDVHFTDVDPIIRPMRRQKDADELALLRTSMKAGEAGMSAAMHGIQPGMTELEAFFLIQRAAQEAIGEQAPIYGDFVSGPRTEQVGGPPSNHKIEKGDLFLLDFSTVVYRYRADFANTWVVGGKATERQRELCHACLEAMQAGEKLFKAGTPCRVVDRAVRAAFEAKGLGENFRSHSGHGIGLGHPEPPYIVPESSETLLAGDVVTLEPGQYIKGEAGMRFERNYLITETGYELLSNHPLAIEV
jgi:Xaa-Pro dipeptidase